ncbi:MAG: hypothetical protein ACLT98_04020 [Eggerthellaceae bacterium]
MSTTCVVIGAIHPDMTNALMWPAAICGGIGVAVIVILWSELYGCLGPVRVALYYSASIVAAALIVYTMKGFLFPWFATFLFMLPIGSLVSLSLAFDSLSERNDPAHRLPRPLSHGSSPSGWQSILLPMVSRNRSSPPQHSAPIHRRVSWR